MTILADRESRLLVDGKLVAGLTVRNVPELPAIRWFFEEK